MTRPKRRRARKAPTDNQKHGKASLSREANQRGANAANAARSAWKPRAHLLWAMSELDSPDLVPKQRGAEVAELISETSPRKVSEKMVTDELRRPDAKREVETYKRGLQRVPQVPASVAEMVRAHADANKVKYEQAFAALVKELQEFLTVSVATGFVFLSGKTPEELLRENVEAAIKFALTKLPARSRLDQSPK